MNTTSALTSKKGEGSEITIIQGRKEKVPEETGEKDVVWWGRQLSIAGVSGGQELAKTLAEMIPCQDIEEGHFRQRKP